MAARSVKIRHDAETRLKIKTSQLINRLTDHALGKIELQHTQVKSIEILLRKTLPDLSQVSGAVEVHRRVEELSDAELAAIAAGGSAGAFAPAHGADEPDSLH